MNRINVEFTWRFAEPFFIKIYYDNQYLALYVFHSPFCYVLYEIYETKEYSDINMVGTANYFWEAEEKAAEWLRNNLKDIIAAEAKNIQITINKFLRGSLVEETLREFQKA